MSAESSVELLNEILKNASGSEFFDNLEKYIGFQLPLSLKLILSLNAYETAYAISELDVSAFEEIETFMRKDFTEEMLRDCIAVMNDYLGVYEHCPDKFKILSGHKKFMCTICRECKNLFNDECQQSSMLPEEESTQNPII